MLEVKIVKVTHSGVDEARKLLPFIQWAHVVGPELAGATEAIAVENEAALEQMYKAQWSRSRVLEQIATANLSVEDEEMKAFIIKEGDYVYRAQLPVWHVERFSAAESQSVQELRQKIDLKTKIALTALIEKRIDDFLSIHQNVWQMEFQLTDQRDRHIGAQIDCAEEMIRARYPAIVKYDPLKFLVWLGAMHTPEKYVHVPVQLFDVRGAPRTVVEHMHRALETKPLEDCKEAMLRYGVSCLSSYRVVHFTDDQIMQMDYAGLCAAVQSLKRKRA